MTVALVETQSLDTLPDELAALLPDDVPALVGAGWIAEHFGITPQAVSAAIKAGRIESIAIPGGGGVAVHALRPYDAVRLWGERVIKRRERAAAKKKTSNQP